MGCVVPAVQVAGREATEEMLPPPLVLVPPPTFDAPPPICARAGTTSTVRSIASVSSLRNVTSSPQNISSVTSAESPALSASMKYRYGENTSLTSADGPSENVCPGAIATTMLP